MISLPSSFFQSQSNPGIGSTYSSVDQKNTMNSQPFFIWEKWNKTISHFWGVFKVWFMYQLEKYGKNWKQDGLNHLKYAFDAYWSLVFESAWLGFFQNFGVELWPKHWVPFWVFLALLDTWSSFKTSMKTNESRAREGREGSIQQALTCLQPQERVKALAVALQRQNTMKLKLYVTNTKRQFFIASCTSRSAS